MIDSVATTIHSGSPSIDFDTESTMPSAGSIAANLGAIAGRREETLCGQDPIAGLPEAIVTSPDSIDIATDLIEGESQSIDVATVWICSGSRRMAF